MTGTAERIRDDKAQFQEHWQPSLEQWFKEGVDTPNLVPVKVRAARITYWEGMEQGEWQA